LERIRNKFHPGLVGHDGSEFEVNDTYEHLGFHLDFMATTLRDKVNKEFARWNRDVPKASFELPWLLLELGTDVH
jgi:hypothetical protein